MILNCILVEAESSSISVLASFIRQVPFLKLSRTTAEPVEVLTHIQPTYDSESRMDLVFLDIHLTVAKGLEVLRLMGSKNCKIILLADSPEYALVGYEYGVVDYLVKPLDFDRFLKAVYRARNTFWQLALQPLNSIKPVMPPDRLVVRAGKTLTLHVIRLEDIIYVKGEKNYISITTLTRNTPLVCPGTMKEMEDRLPATHFARVHKSYIVSLDKVTAIEGSNILVVDPSLTVQPIPMGASYRENLLQYFHNNLLGTKTDYIAAE